MWMEINNNKIFIQSIMKNDMSIFAFDMIGGDLLWHAPFEVSNIYSIYDFNIKDIYDYMEVRILIYLMS